MNSILREYLTSADKLEELSNEVILYILEEVKKNPFFNKYEPELKIIDIFDNEKHTIMLNTKNDELENHYLYIDGSYIVFGEYCNLTNERAYRIRVLNALTDLDYFLENDLKEQLRNIETGDEKCR